MRILFSLLLLVVLTADDVAVAQSSLRAPRIGVLVPGAPQELDEQRSFVAFVQGLKDFGYVVGQDVVLEYRSADRNVSLLPRLAAELVGLKVPVIVAVGTTAIDAAIKATRDIPIVMISGGNPVGRGYAKSVAAPGGNVTGLSSVAEGDEGKRMELLKEAAPWVSRVMVLNADRRKSRAENYRREGKELGLTLESLDVYNAEELKQAFVRFLTSRFDSLVTVRNVFTLRHAEQIIDFALRNRLPSIYESREFVQQGGLMSYGVNYTASWRRSAFYVDKILKGASPAVLPIEPPQFEFLVNLGTANRMGHKIPPEILLEANEVIR